MNDQLNDNIKKEVGMYFDRRLNSDATQDFLNKVDQSDDYRSTFTREKNVRELLRMNVQRPSVSPDVIENIKDRIKRS